MINDHGEDRSENSRRRPGTSGAPERCRIGPMVARASGVTMPTVEERLVAVEARLNEMTDLRIAISAMRDEMRQRFEQVDSRFGQIDRRFEQIDHRFERFDQRFEVTDQKIDRSFTTLDQKIDRQFLALDQKVDRNTMWLAGVQITLLIAILAAFI